MDWNQIKVFAAVASMGSLSGAARELGISQPTAGRYVEALEKELNVRLFDREPRGYAITAEGERLLPQVAAMERAAYALTEIQNLSNDQLVGTVRVTAAEFSSRFIARRLADMREQLPGISLEMLTTNKTVNMSRREADIAIRASLPTSGDLRAKPAYTCHMAAYASRAYVDAHPEVLTEERYNVCDWIVLLERFAADSAFKSFLREKKQVNRFPIQCASIHTVLEAVLGGAGAALLFTEYASDIPDLVQVSPIIDELEMTFWMVAHTEVLVQPRVRAVWDWLDKTMRRDFK